MNLDDQAMQTTEIEGTTSPAAETDEKGGTALNLADLLKDEGLKKQYEAELDKARTQASRTAAAKERNRQQRLAAASLSRAEKEKLMSPEELAEMYRQETEDLRNQIARQDEVREFTQEINGILAESKIPAELFNAGLDYFKQDHEGIRERALMFAKYEFLPKGEFEKAVAAKVKEEVDNKLKSKSPQGVALTGSENPFAKETADLQKQAELFKKDPEAARRLAKAAGVKLWG